jgi:Mg-chelatase subunit ChlD
MKNVHVVIDRTGSMESIKDDAMGGFNEFLTRTAGKGQRWWVWLFDSQGIDLIADGVKASEVERLTPDNYQPRARTPLYDAVGQALAKARDVAAKRNAFVVLTDGKENASREWTAKSVKAALDAIKDDGWQIVFLAVGSAAWDETNVYRGRGVTARAARDGASAQASWEAASLAVRSYLDSGDAAFEDLDIKGKK